MRVSGTTRLNTHSMLDSRFRLLGFGLLTVSGLLLFGRVLGYGYVWDDYFLVRHRVWSDVFHAFATNWDWGALPRVTATYYSPLSSETLILDYFIWGFDPKGYHLTNLVFHILNSLAVFWLIAHLTGRKFVQLAGAVIYLVHPFTMVSLSWIGARPYLVSHLFFILAFVFYLKAIRTDRALYKWAMAGFFLTSLLSFEWAIGFPVVVALHITCFHRPRSKADWSKTVKLFSPIVFVAVLYSGFYLWRTYAKEGTPSILYVLRESAGGHMLVNLGKVGFKALVPYNEFKKYFLDLSSTIGLFYNFGLALLFTSWGLVLPSVFRFFSSDDPKRQEALRWLLFGMGWTLVNVMLVLRSFVIRHGIFLIVGLIVQLVWVFQLAPAYASRRTIYLAVCIWISALMIGGQIEVNRWAPDSSFVHSINYSSYQYVKDYLPPESRVLMEENLSNSPHANGHPLEVK